MVDPFVLTVIGAVAAIGISILYVTSDDESSDSPSETEEDEETIVEEEEQLDEEVEQEAELEKVNLIGPARAEELREEGFESVEDMREATRDELVTVDGIGDRNVGEIMEDL